jgi:predicted nucleic acid-binding protein
MQEFQVLVATRELVVAVQILVELVELVQRVVPVELHMQADLLEIIQEQLRMEVTQLE